MKLKRILVINTAIVLCMLALSVWAWLQLPAESQIAVHFNLQGLPDRYAGKAEGLLLLPAIALGITATNLVVPRIEPHQQNIRRSGPAHMAISIGSAVFLGIVHIVIVASALGVSVDINAVLSIAMGLLFIVIGNYMGKIRRNYFLGVRTPWTLSSERAWHKTNRLASWLYVLHGFAFVVAGFLSNTQLLISLVISLVSCSLGILPTYSYLLWRADTTRSVD